MPKEQSTIGYISAECSLASSGINEKFSSADCLMKVKTEGMEVNLTIDYSSESLPEKSAVAYHPVFGLITYDSHFSRFSTKTFVANLKAADANPSIAAHLIHISSPGGEAFGMHEAFEAIRNLTKPVYAVIDVAAESGGYYIASAAQKVYASSVFSKVGCIGAMAELVDYSGLDEQCGIRTVSIKSAFSPLKNKEIDDVLDGKPEEYIKDFLDPLAKTFIDDVSSVRKSIGADSDALKGKTYYASVAVENGLIDGVKPFEEVLEEIQASAVVKQDDINLLNINLN